MTQGIKSVSSHFREMPKFVMNSCYEVVVGDARKLLSIPIPSSFGVGIGGIEY